MIEVSMRKNVSSYCILSKHSRSYGYAGSFRSFSVSYNQDGDVGLKSTFELNHKSDFEFVFIFLFLKHVAIKNTNWKDFGKKRVCEKGE